MTDIDREVAEQATRLEQESKRLLKITELTMANIKRALIKIALQQRTDARRN